MRVRDDTFQPIQTGRNEVECLYLTAEPGTTAEQAIRSAIITCLRYDVEVKVQHNDEVWHFTPIAMIATVRSTQKGIDTSDRKGHSARVAGGLGMNDDYNTRNL
jgi:hypothetical protein